MKLSKRVSALTPSITLAISAKAKKLRSEGVDVIGFGAGEPDFDTPENIKNAAKQALDTGFTKYVPAAGVLDLRTEVAKMYRERYGLDYAAENVIISVGGKGVLYSLMQALIEDGDEVLITTPYWVSYPPMVTLAGGVPVYVETDETTGFTASPEKIAEKITDRTKMLILNSPSNPTGAAYSREQLMAIAELVIEKDIFVCSDEIYDHILYDGFEFVSFPTLDPRLADRCLIANGLAKTYSMTGWRVGYGVGPKEVIGAMTRLQSHANSGTASFAQSGALEALRGDQSTLDVMLSAFAKRRRIIVDRLNGMEGVTCFEPQGAFYVFPKVSSYYGKSFGDKVIDGSLALSDYLLDEAKVAVVPGIGFGADDFIRLSYATDEESIVKGLDRIETALKKLV